MSAEPSPPPTPLEELLDSLVSIPSAAPEEKALAFFCAERLRKSGFEVQLQEWEKGRFNVIAQKGPASPCLLLSSHLDTVPAFNYGERNPCSMEYRGGYVMGLGVYDMKGGLAVILQTVAALRPSKQMGIRVVLTSDEENISAGTWAAARAGHYQGAVLAVIPEIVDTPTTIAETPLTDQPMPVVLGRRGRAVYRMSISTPSIHGAEGRGISALDVASQIPAALRSIPMPRHERLPAATAFVRRIAGESQALEIPTRAEADIDVHLVPPFTHESFGEFLRAELARRLRLPEGGHAKLALLPRSTPYLQPYEVDPANPYVRRLLSALPPETAARPEYGLTVADENILASLGIPCVSWAPRGGCAHTCDEWLSRADLARLAALYPAVLQQILQA
ncbi:MAG: M20/M25/M40 family metallo-hydrolase [Candidatus Micrarchaeota archaeon]|nr:M20/M25/M40 family metallo-hydrolase [Candidatus Micrarchaeota archaeon]